MKIKRWNDFLSYIKESKEEKFNPWNLDEDDIRDYFQESIDEGYQIEVRYGFVGEERIWNYKENRTHYVERFTKKMVSGNNTPAIRILITCEDVSKNDVSDNLKFAYSIIAEEADADISILDNDGEIGDIEWGSYSWSITNSRKRSLPDHYNLHKVIKSDTPLAYYSKKDDDEIVKDPFEFNLSLEEIEDNKLILSDWVENIEERNRIQKDADFAVILYVDGILSRGLKSKSATSDERKEARKGATAMMSDEDFKSANIENYLNQTVGKIGITPELVELKSLEKVVAAIMCSGVGESYSLLSIVTKDFRAIDNFTYQIKRLISCFVIENPEILNFVYGEFLNEYKILKRRSSNSYKCKKMAMNILKEKEELKPLYDSIMRISTKISKSIISKEIKRGEDLKKIFFKLDSIEAMMRDDEFQLSDDFRVFVDSVKYAATDTSSTERIINKMIKDYYIENTLDRDLKRLQEIESYIEDIFGK